MSEQLIEVFFLTMFNHKYFEYFDIINDLESFLKTI